MMYIIVGKNRDKQTAVIGSEMFVCYDVNA